MEKLLAILLWSLSVPLCFSQDCGTPGEACGDGKECCGGCCIQGICTFTYQNCEAVEYPCIENYCPTGFECYMYKPPPSCIGCDVQNVCHPFKDPGPGHY